LDYDRCIDFYPQEGAQHLNMKLNPKIIKEMCGLVSFKRGEAFYRANKVIFENYSSDSCVAKVIGTEDFHVMVENDADGILHTKCSCPKLASFKKDCQHIAAVLLSIYEHQRLGTIPIITTHSNYSTDNKLSDGLLTIFNEQPT
jgi:predicted nucleic acid-binding Zn finger protein